VIAGRADIDETGLDRFGGLGSGQAGNGHDRNGSECLESGQHAKFSLEGLWGLVAAL